MGSEDEAASVADPEFVVVVVIVAAAVDSAAAVLEAKREAFNRDEMWVVQDLREIYGNDGSKKSKVVK